MIRKGQKVEIKPEWQDPGDDQFTWIALEYEDSDRLKIMALMPELPIPPVQIVESRMLIEGHATES